MSTFLIFLQTSSCILSRFLTSYDVWKDFVVPIGITLLASGFAYWIFVAETRRDKRKERKAERQLQKDKLYYFANSVNSIIKISEQQNDNILVFAKEQLADPDEVKHLMIFSMNELRRVTTDLQLESYMLAYVNYYKDDRQVAIKEFNNIIVRVDMLHGTFKAMNPHLQLLKEDERNAKEKFSGYFEKASRLVAVLALSLQSSAPQLSVEVNKIAGASLIKSKTEKTNAEFCYRTYMVPIYNFAFKYCWTDLPETPQIQELASLTKNGRLVYEQMIVAHLALGDEFQAQHDRLKPEIDKLKELAKRLLDDFEV
ncbi:hypothetical protein [Pedobacter namyangjuensis]|uniref:hypothetical protein n=1 Tax=Pedobacter namyangjuensis TaxID=600626 RepID=UPI000DE1F624|nr:hypothetical protein [Pedobacter namyangjuensis]